MPIPGFGALGRLRGALLTPNPHPSCRVPSLPAGHYPHLRPALSQAGSATMNPSDSLTCFGHHFTLAAYRLPYLRLPPQNRPRPPRVTAPTLPNALSLTTPYTSQRPVSSAFRLSDESWDSFTHNPALHYPTRARAVYEATSSSLPLRLGPSPSDPPDSPHGGHPVRRLLDAADTPRLDSNQLASATAWCT